MDKSQPPSIIQRQFEQLLKGRSSHNNNVSSNQKQAFQVLYGNINHQDYNTRPLLKNMCDSYSNTLFSNSTHPPNLICKSNEEKQIQKSDNLFSDETNHTIDCKLPQYSVEHSEDYTENVYRNHKSSTTETSLETVNNKQCFNWFCGNNFGNNKNFNLSENQLKTNDQINKDNVLKHTTPIQKFGMKSVFNPHGHNHDLYKTEQDNTEYEIPIKKIKYEPNHFYNTAHDTCITKQ